MTDGAEITADLTLGFGSESIANPEPATLGEVVRHEGLSELCPGKVRLEGEWIHQKDYVEYAGEGMNTITVVYTGAKVSVTFSTADGSPNKLAVLEDLPPLDRDYAGVDAVDDQDHGCAVTVTTLRDYDIVNHEEVEPHELVFEVYAKGLRVHGMKFAGL